MVDWILDFTMNFSCFSGLEILESPDLHNPTLLKGIYQRWPQSGPYERKKPVLELLEADVSCVFFRCDWCWSVTPGSRKSLEKKMGKTMKRSENLERFGVLLLEDVMFCLQKNTTKNRFWHSWRWLFCGFYHHYIESFLDFLVGRYWKSFFFPSIPKKIL